VQLKPGAPVVLLHTANVLHGMLVQSRTHCVDPVCVVYVLLGQGVQDVWPA
jgi:hypothetical protein